MTDLSTHAPSSRLPLVDARRKHAGFITGWLFWSDLGDYEKGNAAVWGFQWDELFIAFGVMSCECPATSLISDYPPLIIDFSVFNYIFFKCKIALMDHGLDTWHTGPYSSPGVVNIC